MTRQIYTFDDIFNTIKNKINEFTTDKPTYWGEGSIIRAISQSLAYFIQFLQLQVNITSSSFRIATAQGKHLDNRVGDFNLIRKQPTPSISLQAFYGASGRTDDILINNGLEVKTEDDFVGNSLTYTLLEDLILTSGNVFVTGYCSCNTLGTIGNLPSGTITVLSTTIAGITGTTNLQDISNGSDLETDEQLRARVPSYLLGLKKGTKDAIVSAVYEVPSVTYVDVTENSPTSGNFTVYVSNETGILDDIDLQLITNKIEETKGFCLSYTIIVPTISNITLSMDITVDNINYNQVNILSLIKSTLYNYINAKRTNTLYISDIISIVKSINGVLNIKNVKINSASSDLELDKFYAIKLADEADIVISVV